MASPRNSKKKTSKEASSDDANSIQPAQRPRLRRITIKNFRCIGSQPVNVDLDNIVILVGPNNAGKSSILRACEVALEHGSNKGHLSREDFPGHNVDTTNPPQIILETVVYEQSAPAARWVAQDGPDKVVRERFTWTQEGAPTKEGFDPIQGTWESDVPWGAAGVAKSARPKPVRIEAFANPDEQAAEIVSLLSTRLFKRLKSIKSPTDGESAEGLSTYRALIEQLNRMQEQLLEEHKGQVNRIEGSVANILGEVFPGYGVEIKARHDEDKLDNLFKAGLELRMGLTGGLMTDLAHQGSGARRTMLWAILKWIAEDADYEKSQDRPYLLLMDEPELCLHPDAIREARDILFKIADGERWQVMITTHSPVFVDFARDNTAIVRVRPNSVTKNSEGTTIFRSRNIGLDTDALRQLKLLNQCDPHLAEFFFCGRTIVVEGDTEYTAFQSAVADLDEIDKKKYKGIHIVRARGKHIIVAICRILNQFRSPYSVLHDSDKPDNKVAWAANNKVLQEVQNGRNAGVAIRLVAFMTNFEEFCGLPPARKDKPYAALERLRCSPSDMRRVRTLLEALLEPENRDKALPTKVLEWNSLAELQQEVDGVPLAQQSLPGIG